jgi:formate-dependent phosphoribosylglycinamide formyltransferase (GAR transformylase)
MAKSVYVNRSILENGYEVGIEFPCVMKAVFGAHGNDNYLVNSLEEVRRIAQASALRFVLQRMIPNDGVVDLIAPANRFRCNVKILELEEVKEEL